MSTQILRTRPASTTLYVAGGVAVAALALTAIAVGAIALGADAAFLPLQPGPYLTLGIVGVLAAIAGWVLIVRLVPRSARLLRILVPVLLLLTLIPDVVLLSGAVFPGTTVVGVVALMLMHVVIAAIAVVVGQRIAPAH